MIVDLPLGEWLPDQPDQKNALVKAEGVVADAGCYRPIPSLLTVQATLPSGICAGAFKTARAAGDSVVCVGTSSDLFVIVGTTVTASGLALSLGVNPIWVFERFNRFVFATAGGVTYYLPDIASSAVFLPLTGSPPQARAMGRVGDFLILGNLTLDIDASFSPYRIRWSGFNNPAGSWVDDIGTESGAVDMDATYGEVTAIAGGRYGLICQQDAISRIFRSGTAASFSKELIEEDRGCVATASVVRVGAFAFGLGRDGFWQCNGATVQLISSGRVWDWFLANADTALIPKTQATVDYRSRCIIWNFFGQGSASRNRQLIWAWDQNKWTAASITVDWAFARRIPGAVVDSAVEGAVLIDNSLDLVDAARFSEDKEQFAGFVGLNLLVANGPPIEAILETGELQPVPGYRAMVRGVAPIMEGAATGALLSVGVRTSSAGESVMYSPESSPGAQGFAPQRKDGRYLRVAMRIPAGTLWSKASALQVDFVQGGRG